MGPHIWIYLIDVVFSVGIPMNHDLPQKETPDLTGPDLKSWWIAAANQKKQNMSCVFCIESQTQMLFVCWKSPIMSMIFLLPPFSSGILSLSTPSSEQPTWSNFGIAAVKSVFVPTFVDLGMGQNPVPLVNIKIAGKWMFIPLKMVLIGMDPYPFSCWIDLEPGEKNQGAGPGFVFRHHCWKTADEVLGGCRNGWNAAIPLGFRDWIPGSFRKIQWQAIFYHIFTSKSRKYGRADMWCFLVASRYVRNVFHSSC